MSKNSTAVFKYLFDARLILEVGPTKCFQEREFYNTLNYYQI
jgi:hypothetical protein